MSWLLAAPILTPMTTAIVCLLVRRHARVERAVSVAGGGLLLAPCLMLLVAVWNGGPLAGQMGSWPAPYGITLVADLFSAVMVAIAGLTGFAVAVYGVADIDRERQRFGFHTLYHILLGGVCGAFLTGDLFNLYVWFEVMLIASFALITLGGERAQLDGAVKYAAINLVSTVLLLTAIGLTYGATGTLNMADLSVRVGAVENQGLVSVLAVLFLIALGIKAAVFPLFFWLPASYHTPPVAVTAILSALMTKVGVYALMRVFTLIFTDDVGFTHTLLLWVAALTMITGVLGAAAQTDVRRILSFHIVSQIGYMVLGLALYTPLAIAGAVFYLVHNILAKTSLFLVGGMMGRLGGCQELSRIGGFYQSAPLLAVIFLIAAFSLAGFPPLSGFWAKFILVKASLDLEHYVIAAVALGVGLMTIYSMTKIWILGFWKPAPGGSDTAPVPAPSPGETTLRLAPAAALTALTVVLGVSPEPFLEVATRAAAELFEPRAYVEAVLGERP
ncbi:MAG: Na+/H+ antiporter subunit D [Rhodospirillales bacterium]|nr:Na+/H+ antiporter subunit D [Rhodospirillales bacterium]